MSGPFEYGCKWGRRRDLAMFNLAIDSKLRGCDLVRLRIDDVSLVGEFAIARPSFRRRPAGRCSSRLPSRPVLLSASGSPLSMLARADICSQADCGESHTCRRGNTPAPSIDGRTAPGSIARHMARTLCAERSPHRFTRRPAICEQCSCYSATRSWRALCVISASRLMMRSASRSRSNFSRAHLRPC